MPSARKYRNVPTQFQGQKYDSKAELRRHGELQLLERAGVISDLKRQVPYELAPSVKLYGATRAQPALRYVVDFQYVERGALVLEDTKGIETPMSKTKRHLMKHIHGLDVRLTK